MSFSLTPWGKKQPPHRESLTDRLADAMSRCSKRVLLLEDDHNWRDLVRAVAQDFEIEVFEAANSTDARTMVERESPDTVVVDIGVTNGDGIIFYRWIKNAYPRINVIFLTCSRVDDVADKIHAIGSAPIYSKPAVMSVNFLTDFIEKMGAKKRTYV